MLGKEIIPVTVAKDLGVYIDQSLTYNDQITKTVSTCIHKLIQINRIKQLPDKKAILLLMSSFVFSRLYYCSTVWSNTSKHNIKKLQCSVVVFGLKSLITFHKVSTLSTGCLLMTDLNDNDAVMMFKRVNELVPDYLIGKFTQRSQTHTKNNRQGGQLNSPRCRTTTGERSFTYRTWC